MEGKEFGKWTVLNYIYSDKPGKHYECICECGVIAIKAGTTLRAGRSTQCRDCRHDYLFDPNRRLGMKFGKWTVTSFMGMHKRSQQFEVTCKCGNKGKNIIAELKKGRSTQCRVCGDRQAAVKNRAHGMNATKLYKIWSSMKHRCLNENSTVYKYYGGRGIMVCERWLKFENFYEDMGEKQEGMTLDRIDNDGDYKKSNCRWITHKDNCNNTRKNRIIKYKGESKSLTQWAESMGVTFFALNSYLKTHSFEEAVKFYKKKNKLKE